MQPETIADETLVETLLLSSRDPLSREEIEARLPPGIDVMSCLASLSEAYADRSIRIVEVAGGWTARTRPELSKLCREVLEKPPRLSKAALETLAVVAYFQPVTRPEIERVRGVSLAKGTLDILIWAGLVRPGARRQSPGTPLTFVTTDAFLRHYALAGLEDLPGMERLRAEGVLDASPDLGIKPAEAEEGITSA